MNTRVQKTVMWTTCRSYLLRLLFVVAVVCHGVIVHACIHASLRFSSLPRARARVRCNVGDGRYEPTPLLASWFSDAHLDSHGAKALLDLLVKLVVRQRLQLLVAVSNFEARLRVLLLRRRVCSQRQ